MSRRIPKNAPDPSRARDEWQFKNRTQVAQIVGVDDVNGVITVRTATTLEEHRVVVPLGGFSVNGVSSSWMRYMPQKGDFVKIGFGIDNRPEVVGYAAWGEDGGEEGLYRVSGYAQVRKFADKNIAGLATFRRLKPGEWDMHSSGGADIYGTRNGRLQLAGGATSIELDKDRYEARHDAGLHVHAGDGCEVRIGDVKRAAIPAGIETDIPGATKEWHVTVGELLPATGTQGPVYYEEQAGDVRDGLGLPVPATGTSFRYRKVVRDATGLSDLFSLTVDALGNVNITHAPSAVTGVDVDGGATVPLNVTFASVDVNATTGFTANGGTTATLDAVRVNLGAGTEPVIKGTTFVSNLVTALSASFGALTSAGGKEAVLATLPALGTALAAALSTKVNTE